jgi:hypothetical protein
MTESEVLFLKICASFRIKDSDERKVFLENKEVLYTPELNSDKLMICKDCQDLFFTDFKHSHYLCNKCNNKRMVLYKKRKRLKANQCVQ